MTIQTSQRHSEHSPLETRRIVSSTGASAPIASPRGICPECFRLFEEHTYRSETLQVQCPDRQAQRPLSDWLESQSDLDPIPAFRHDRSTVLGTRFDSLDHEAVVAYVLDAIAIGHGGWVVTPNVDILRLMANNPAYKSLVHHATLVLVDGAPVQWAARMSGQAFVHRTPGSTLMLPLAAAAAQRGVPLLLLGGRDGAGERAAAVLLEAYPQLDVHWHCPPVGFENDRAEWREVERVVALCTPGIVMCGLGAPKQELVASRLLACNPGTWFLGVGGTIDFTAGMVSRPPEWIQQTGMEWLYRLLVEPRRLFHRYVIDDLPFAARMFSWAIRTRARRTRTEPLAERAGTTKTAALPQAGSRTREAA